MVITFINRCRSLCTLGLLALALLAAPAHGQDAPLLMVEQGTHSAPVRRIDVDAARGLAVTAADDRSARVWDLASGELRQVLRPLAFGAEGGRLYGVAIHPQQPWVAVGGSTGGDGHAHVIYLYDLASGALLRTIDARGGHVRKLAWSADGSVLLAAYAGERVGERAREPAGEHAVRAFALDGRMLLEQPMAAPVFGLAVSAHGLAAAAALDGSVRILRAGGGEAAALHAFSMGARRAAGLAFSPDGQQLAIAYADVTIGANGRESLHEPVEIVEVAGGRSIRKLAVVPLHGGELRMLAWSADGRTIHAAGTAYTRDYGFPIVRFDVASGGAIEVATAAGDSITDLVALPDGAVAFSSFDGSWGVWKQGRVLRRVASGLMAVRGGMADDLELSADARAVRWGVKSAAGSGSAGRGFAFDRRHVGPKIAAALRAPETSFSLFNRPSDWNLSRGQPIVGGRVLELAPDERPRALAVVRANKTVAIGTNRALYQLDEQGQRRWRTAVDTELRAVHASDDGRWIVGALADGTLRWWRARDGVHVLSLLVDAEGRWVAWTPGGYFDASAGADRLVGWALADATGRTMDFYSLNRFRARFHRPELIDALFETQDVQLALDALNARDAALQATAQRDAEALRSQSVVLARAADEAARAQRDAEALAAREREAARLDGARRQAALDAERAAQAMAARRDAAAREAAAREASAALAAAEVAAREAAMLERKALAVVKALEVPPALSGPAGQRIRSSAPEVTLQFAVASAGQPANLLLEVRVNGRPAQPTELVLPKSFDGTARGFAKLPLEEGESLVEILARNAYGVSEPLAYRVERAAGPAATAAAVAAAAAKPSGDLYVLAIGVSDYHRADYRLALAAKDARDFAAALQPQQGRQYRQVHVRLLTDRDATRANMLKAFEWLRLSVGPQDVAMLFMAGHGLNDGLGQYHFLPADGQHERLAATALSQGTIVSTLARVRGKTLLFLDTCFAGNSLGALSRLGRQTEKMMNDLAASENGVVVFASSTGQEESEEKPEWGNGAFTKVLIEGLAGKADFTGIGRVTFAALNLFLSEGVARLTQGRQRPVFISPRGVPDFALVRL